MKKTILMLLFAMPLTQASAYDYNYLNLQATDGTVTSIDVASLKLTVSDGKLLAVNSSTNQEFTLSELSKMYFSSEASATGINELSTSDGDYAEVYTLAGLSKGKFTSVSEAKENLPAGIYIIKSQNKTYKVTVK